MNESAYSGVPALAVHERASDSSLRCRARASDGFTLLEVLFVSGLIAILSAIAVPALLRSRASANEASAVASIRVVHTAQLTFALSCGLGLYASSFPGLADPTDEGFLPGDMTASPTPVKSGYTYTLQPGTGGLTPLIGCNGAPLSVDYYVAAVPAVLTSTGNRAFASNPSHVIWQDVTGVAPVEPFEEAGSVAPIK